MANDDLAKLDQLTIEKEKMEKDNDNIDVSKENYFNNKSLGKVLGKNDAAPRHFFRNGPVIKVKSEVKDIIIRPSHKFVINYTPKSTIFCYKN